MVYETIFPDNCLKVGDGEKVKISCLHKPGSLIKITEVKYGDKHDDCGSSAFADILSEQSSYTNKAKLTLNKTRR
jgi:hypothetical protein